MFIQIENIVTKGTKHIRAALVHKYELQHALSRSRALFRQTQLSKYLDRYLEFTINVVRNRILTIL